VLIVHCAGGGYDQGLAFGEPLSSGWRIIAMSRFGYLRTPLPPDAWPPHRPMPMPLYLTH
jgi:2-hydroxy-6-oxonona-2,4-dienedioate hydrolase